MLFNSLTFIVFFVVIVSLYWSLRGWQLRKKLTRRRQLHFLWRVEPAVRGAPVFNNSDGLLARPPNR